MEMSLLGLVYLIVLAFFCFSVFKVLKAVPEQHQRFPAWLIWLTLLPIAGLVFIWIMLPFGVPQALKNFSSKEKPEAMADCKVIFSLGLAYAILVTVSIIPLLGLFTLVASFVVLIVYWSQIVSFRKRYLESSEFKKTTVKSQKSV